MYRLTSHCCVTRYIWSDSLTNWAMARVHVTAPCVTCKMTAMFVHLGAVVPDVQIEKFVILTTVTV